jgi:hypothetical protein
MKQVWQTNVCLHLTLHILQRCTQKSKGSEKAQFLHMGYLSRDIGS